MPIYTKVENLYKKGEYLKATQLATQLIPQHKNEALLYYFRATSYYYLKLYNDALSDLNRAIQLLGKKANSWQYYYRAVSYRELNQLSNAKKDIDLAVKLCPNHKSPNYQTYCNAQEDITLKLSASSSKAPPTPAKAPVPAPAKTPTVAAKPPALEKNLHDAVFSENLNEVKKLLTDSNYDLKNQKGKTPLKLLLEKYEAVRKKTGKKQGTRRVLAPAQAKEIMILLLQKGAATNAQDQLLLIYIGVDVIGIKDELTRQLLSTQKQQTPLFKQIIDEQNALRKYMKAFSLDLNKDVDLAIEKIDEVIDALNGMGDRLDSVEEKSDLIESAIDLVITAVKEQGETIASHKNKLARQDEQINLLNSRLLLISEGFRLLVLELSQRDNGPEVYAQLGLPTTVSSAFSGLFNRATSSAEPIVFSDQADTSSSCPGHG